MKGKAQYSEPPCTDFFNRHIEDIIYFLQKTTYNVFR